MQAGPVKGPLVQYTTLPTISGGRDPKGGNRNGPEEDELSDAEDQIDDDDESEQDGSTNSEDMQEDSTQDAPSRKRKRAAVDNLEDSYMERLAREDDKEADKRREDVKKRKMEEQADDETSADQDEEQDENQDSEDESSPPPVHESLTGEREAVEVDKSNRTVFLSNVSNLAIKSKTAKKTLLDHLSSFLSTIPESGTPHKVESIRFRSTAYATKLGVPRRAAYAHKELMDTTTPSTNAYAVYSTALAAQKAPGALNGTVVLDRHLRVDNVAHPAPIDNKRCVFVGNLDFVDQDNDTDAEDEDSTKKKKKRAPADVEEGLWRTFNAHTGAGEKKGSGSGKGNVESVRVVRDRATRIGKGFAYVQFYDPNCVEAALLLDGKRFPPMLPRKLRVVRAKKVKKRHEGPDRSEKSREVDGARKTLRGRAGKLLGRAGAAKLRESEDGKPFIFEGQRAAEGTSLLKMKNKSRGSKGKPKNRSTRRAQAYREASGKPGKKEAK
jgi:nucleolar protein 12